MVNLNNFELIALATYLSKVCFINCGRPVCWILLTLKFGAKLNEIWCGFEWKFGAKLNYFTHRIWCEIEWNLVRNWMKIWCEIEWKFGAKLIEIWCEIGWNLVRNWLKFGAKLNENLVRKWMKIWCEIEWKFGAKFNEFWCEKFGAKLNFLVQNFMPSVSRNVPWTTTLSVIRQI